jgi:hypothetical protein
MFPVGIVARGNAIRNTPARAGVFLIVVPEGTKLANFEPYRAFSRRGAGTGGERF